MAASAPPQGTPATPGPTARKAAVLTSLAIVAVAAAVRLYHLTAPGLWLDEGGSLQQSSGSSWWAMLAELAHTNEGDHFQPLYFALLYLWRAIAGSSVFSLRIPSVLFSLAALAVIAAIAARVFGRLHALITATLVAVSAFFVIHAQEARPYALLLFLDALFLLLFVRVREERPQRAYPPASWALWACFGIAALASITMAIMAAGLALGDAVVDRHPRRWLRTWLPCVAAAVPALVFSLLSSTATDPRSAGVTQLSGPLLRNAVFAVYGVVAGVTYGPPIEQLRGPDVVSLMADYWPSLLVLAVAMAAAVTIAVVNISRGDLTPGQRSFSLTLLVAFLASYVLMYLFAFVAHMNWQPRHSYFLALPLFLLLPLAIRCGSNGRRRFCRLVGGAALIVVALANVHSLGHYYWNEAYARDDYRAVADYVRASSDPDRRSVLLYGYPILLRYYDDRDTIDGTGIPTDRLPEMVRSLSGEAPRVLLISNREWAFWQRPESIVDAMSDGGYTFEGSARFPYFTLYRFALRQDSRRLDAP